MSPRAFAYVAGGAGVESSMRVNRAEFFFFQAEDGIRGVAVTGVQTCALPISPAFSAIRKRRPSTGGRLPTTLAQPPRRGWRSEERRVGKECRSGWLRPHLPRNIKNKIILCV